jgi:hypothetical protein
MSAYCAILLCAISALTPLSSLQASDILCVRLIGVSPLGSSIIFRSTLNTQYYFLGLLLVNPTNAFLTAQQPILLTRSPKMVNANIVKELPNVLPNSNPFHLNICYAVYKA